MAEHDDLKRSAEIANMFAHDIKNHLSSINLNADMLEESLNDAGHAEDIRRLERIKISLSNIQDAVQDFLRLANPLDVDCRPLDLARLLQELVDFIEPECFASSISIDLEVQDPVPEVATEPEGA